MSERYSRSKTRGLYDIDVNSLEVQMLYEDGNVMREKAEKDPDFQIHDLLPGAHGKGLYSGQGVLVYSNNGELSPEAMEQFDVESGALSEWDGKDWKVIRRNQFVEVTGPRGIGGSDNPQTDPIWTSGWDHKSILVGLRDNGEME